MYSYEYRYQRYTNVGKIQTNIPIHIYDDIILCNAACKQHNEDLTSVQLIDSEVNNNDVTKYITILSYL